MATTHIFATCLYSGQGMCNTVEVYDGGTLKYLMLVDFGAEKDTANVRTFTLEKLVEIVDTYGKIDAMVISHSDADHWKMMNELLDLVKSTVTIDVAAFGIGKWEKTALTFKNKVIARMSPGKSVTLINAARSDIGATLRAWYKAEGVTFNILAGSVVESDVTPHSSSDVESNTASIVLRVLFEGNYVIFNGDATTTTISYINQKLAGHGLSNNCFMMTAPHHGALATLYGTLTPLATYTAAATPECSLASAQLRVNFNHPNVCVMSTISKYAKKKAWPHTGGKHDTVLNFRDTALCSTDSVYKTLDSEKTSTHHQDWYVVQTDYNIFTNLSTLTTITDWQFKIEADGTTTVDRIAVKTTTRFFAMAAQPDESFTVGVPPGFQADAAGATTDPAPPPPRPTRQLPDE